MPELPEVETIKLGLQKYLIGHKIDKVDVISKRLFQGNPRDLEGAKVLDVRRFGKGLIIDFDNKMSLAIHVKMTGQLIYQDEEVKKISMISREKVGSELPNFYTRAIFFLDKKAILYFNDRRHFAWMKVVSTKEVMDLSFFKKLGPEFLKDLTEEKFNALLQQSRTRIKPLIMDQEKMAGVGNIYANDALFLAGIDPRRIANELKKEEVKRLYKSISEVLKKALKYQGSSENAYVNALGEEGKYQDHTLVYGKKGEPCPNDCGGKIERISLGGRGTFFCPSCQK